MATRWARMMLEILCQMQYRSVDSYPMCSPCYFQPLSSDLNVKCVTPPGQHGVTGIGNYSH